MLNINANSIIKVWKRLIHACEQFNYIFSTHIEKHTPFICVIEREHFLFVFGETLWKLKHGHVQCVTLHSSFVRSSRSHLLNENNCLNDPFFYSNSRNIPSYRSRRVNFVGFCFIMIMSIQSLNNICLTERYLLSLHSTYNVDGSRVV